MLIMKTSSRYLLSLALLSCGGDNLPDSKPHFGARGAFVPNSYLVVAKTADKNDAELGWAEEKLRFAAHIAPSLAHTQLSSLHFIGNFSASSGTGLALSELNFVEGANAQAILQAWQASGVLHFFEPNWLNTLAASDRAPYGSDDDEWWWAEQIRLKAALQNLADFSLAGERTLAEPIVAVLDSGIDFAHPALADAIWHPPAHERSACPGDDNGCNTARGSSRDFGVGHTVHPYATSGVNEVCPLNWHGGTCMHGTHVAGIIAGRPAGGMNGICQFCKVVNVRVVEEYGGSGKVADASILRGLKYISQFHDGQGHNTVRLVNLSFGKYKRGRAVSLFIEHLSRLRDGVLVVASAGNEDSQSRIYPAAHDAVFAVSSVAASGKKASYSNFGTWVHIAAPGGEVLEGYQFAINSSVPGGGIGPSQGTSMAAPMVSAVAALVLAVEPEITIVALKQRLLRSADPELYSPHFASGYNARSYYPDIDGRRYPLLGAGLLDAQAALEGRQRGSNALERKERISTCGKVALLGPRSNTRLLFLLPLLGGALGIIGALRRLLRGLRKEIPKLNA